MPKLKTHKGMKKRFKVSANGKVQPQAMRFLPPDEPQERQAGAAAAQESTQSRWPPRRSGSASPCSKAERQSPTTSHAQKLAAVAEGRSGSPKAERVADDPGPRRA